MQKDKSTPLVSNGYNKHPLMPISSTFASAEASKDVSSIEAGRKYYYTQLQLSVLLNMEELMGLSPAGIILYNLGAVALLCKMLS